jgi:hypothetical protein
LLRRLMRELLRGVESKMLLLLLLLLLLIMDK